MTKVSAIDRPDLVRKLVIVAIAVPALIFAVIAVGISTTAALVAPQIALRWNPYNADALSAASFAIIEADASPASLAKAEDLALRSYERSPLSPASVRTLGYIADMRGQSDRALALMSYSLRLSRRDLSAHLWFINNYVNKEDLYSALNHYDMALRTSELAQTVLMPILINATEDRRLVRPLAIILDRRPVWKDDFLTQATSKGPSVVNLAELSRHLAASENALSVPQMVTLTNRLVAEEQFTTAAKLVGRSYQNQLIANGSFTEAVGVGPFDWKLANEYDLAAAVSDGHLQIETAAGRGGDVATQMLLLSPGRYALAANASTAAANMTGLPFWTLTCVTGGKQRILTVDVSRSLPRQSSPEAEFDVPVNGCGAQALTLSIRSTSDTQNFSGWVDNVAVTRVAAPGRI